MNDKLKFRGTILLWFAGIVMSVYGLRLFYLQVVSDDFAISADKNVLKKNVIQPSRGIVYDRNRKIYVTNSPIYDLVIVPKDLYIPDTSIFQEFINLSPQQVRDRITSAKKYSPRKASIFEKQIDANLYAGLQEKLWECEGITTVVRNTRQYRYSAGGSFLGYISEVTKRDIEKSSGYYSQGDLMGASGIERYYEELLRGRKGVKTVMVDVHGREVGAFAEGKYDTLPEKGKDIIIGIDADLQAFGEQLMQKKRGSIVAIEPSSGEILAFVSAPTYDPNLLSGRDLPNQWRNLQNDKMLPLFNRPLMATYPPGSVFKLLNAMTALSEGTITPGTLYGCSRGFARNGGKPGCHQHPSPTNVTTAIQHSCNAYFAGIFVDFLNNSKYKNVQDAYEKWYTYMRLFGAGRKLGVDIPNEKPGNIPTKDYFNKVYGKNRWKGMTVVSLSIGQGEVTMTPLQMANSVCAIANRGYYIQPHFLKNVLDEDIEKDKYLNFDTVQIPIDRGIFDLVAEAMEKVVTAGTASQARVDSIVICGKTGTAQNPGGADHSVFIAFAPKDNPKIAIAVIVENSGWGNSWAAPITALMIEKYLKGRITDQNKLNRILEADLLNVKPTPKKK